MKLIQRTLLPIMAAMVAAAVISGIWYSPMVIGGAWVSLRAEWLHVAPDAYIAPWKSLVELLREIIVATMLTRLIAQLNISRVASAVRLGFWLWLGFPIVMLVGASLWDNKPWVLSVIHGGDWLIKLLVMPAVIVVSRGLWDRKESSRVAAAANPKASAP